METFSVLLNRREGNPPVTGGVRSQMSSNAELRRFLWPVPKQTVKQTIETPLIWDAIALTMTSL